MDSLRELYAGFKDYKNKLYDDRNIPLLKVKDLIQEYRNLFEKVICPNCLKTIIIRELQFICPYCDKVHGEVKSKSDNPLINIFSTFAEMIDDFGKSKILYEACYCGGEIRYLNCPYCHNDIDLFAPYDYQELKSQRTR